MILIDYNGVAMASIHTALKFADKNEIDENFIRHMILNSFRMYNKKYRKDYGNLVVCCDAGGNWRWDFYEHYKANRKKDRDASDLDWEEIFRVMNAIREEMIEFLPWKVVKVHGCEADDVVATLVETTQEFGQYEKVMIVSADGDFKQLQRYDNVEQFSPITKKKVVEPNPKLHLFEKLCRGDSGDGVPNVASQDDIFLIEGKRQSQVSQAKIDGWVKADNLEDAMGPELYRNFQRNKRMIDLSMTPDALKSEIINTFNSQSGEGNANTVMNYLIKKRCKQLIEDVGDFL